MEFTVRPMQGGTTCHVSYACDCGCKPGARYVRGSAEAGHEHCCCGKVHFAGSNAREQLEAYLEQRRLSGEDEGIAYTFGEQTVAAPWGESLPVAYAIPR